MNSPASFETAFSSYSRNEVIGQGGAGKVYRVTDTGGQPYALKCLGVQNLTTERRKRFQNEIFFCLKLEHPHVVKVVDYGTILINGASCPFYVKPLYGDTLRGLLNKRIPPARVLLYFSQALDGVEAAHLKKSWHRDLKPENILYDGASDCLVVADFGIARFSEELLQTLVETADHVRLANFQYAAPEQRSRGAHVDHRADIFSLGLILNEMFTGERPEGSGHKTIASVAPEYGYLDELVDLMRRQNSAERPNSIDEIKKTLIARRSEFVSRQRLSSLKAQVVPQSKVDDPLRDSPVTVIGADYQHGRLILQLSQRVTADWVKVFRGVTNVEYISGYEPERFQIHDNTATVDAQERDVQSVIDTFKRFLVRAQENYGRAVKAREDQKELTARQALRTEAEEEEKRQRILKRIQI